MLYLQLKFKTFCPFPWWFGIEKQQTVFCATRESVLMWFINIPVCPFTLFCDFVLCAAAVCKQSCSCQMEESDAAEDGTGGQRRDLSTQRTLPGSAGEVRGVTVVSPVPSIWYYRWLSEEYVDSFYNIWTILLWNLYGYLWSLFDNFHYFLTPLTFSPVPLSLRINQLCSSEVLLKLKAPFSYNLLFSYCYLFFIIVK